MSMPTQNCKQLTFCSHNFCTPSTLILFCPCGHSHNLKKNVKYIQQAVETSTIQRASSLPLTTVVFHGPLDNGHAAPNTLTVRLDLSNFKKLVYTSSGKLFEHYCLVFTVLSSILPIYW